MTIKEVSEKYGISQDTLRYYERVNVIPKVTSRRLDGWQCHLRRDDEGRRTETAGTGSSATAGHLRSRRF